MFCNKCGAQLPDGATFCSSCGATQSTDPAAPAGAGSPLDPQNSSTLQGGSPFEQPPVPPKKKGLGKGGIIAAVGGAAVVLIVAIAFFATTAHGAFLRTFGSPESYFNYVQSKEADDSSGSVSGVYSMMTKSLTSDKSSSHATLTLNLGDKAKDLLSSMAGGADLSFLDGMTVDMDLASSDDLASFAMKLGISQKTIMTLSTFVDIANGEILISVPELTDKLVSTDVDWDSYNSMSEQNEIMLDVLKALPSDEVVDKLLKKYINIFAKNIGDVSKTKATLSAGDISESCVKLSVEIDEEDMANIMEAVLTELKKDKDIESAIKDVTKALEKAGADVEDDPYDEFIATVDDMLETVKDARSEGFDSSNTIDVEEYINGKHEIVGLNIYANDEEILSYAMPSKGSKFALNVSLNEGEFEIRGDGTLKGSKKSGSFDVFADGQEYFTVELENLDVSAMDKEKLSGTVRLIPGDDLLNQMGSSGAMAFIDPALELKMDISKNNSKIDINILSGDELFAGVTANANSSSSGKVTKPSGDVLDLEDEDDVLEFVESLNFDTISNNLRSAGVPDEIVNLVDQLQTQLENSLSGSNSYYNSYYDYNDYYNYYNY